MEKDPAAPLLRKMSSQLVCEEVIGWVRWAEKCGEKEGCDSEEKRDN